MALVILMMIYLPGGLDSRRMARAWSHYHDSPNEVTLKELDDARIADRKQVVKIELVLGSFLALSVFLFFKSRRNKWNLANQK